MIGKAKGSVLVHLRHYIEEFHGPELWRSLLDALPPQDRATLEGLVLSGSWYPVTLWNRALDVFLPLAYSDPEAGMAKLAGYIAEKDLNRVFKMILQMGSPEFLMKRANSLWSRYYNTGQLDAEEVSRGHWSLTLRVPEGWEAAPSHFTCGPGLNAWLVHGLRATGTEGRVTTTSNVQGTVHVIEVRWGTGLTARDGARR